MMASDVPREHNGGLFQPVVVLIQCLAGVIQHRHLTKRKLRLVRADTVYLNGHVAPRTADGVTVLIDWDLSTAA